MVKLVNHRFFFFGGGGGRRSRKILSIPWLVGLFYLRFVLVAPPIYVKREVSSGLYGGCNGVRMAVILGELLEEVFSFNAGIAS